MAAGIKIIIKGIIDAMKTGRLRMKGMVAHFLSLIRLSRVMSVHP